MQSRLVLAFLCCGLVSAVDVSPVEKVITLLEDLKTESEEAGKKEANTYDTFACFCKDTTITKSDAIKTEQDNIDEFAATLEEQTGISNAKQAETEELGEMIRTLDKEMTEITARREKEKAKYEATAADLSKAVSSLEGAIADMQAGKGASFLSVKKGIRKSIAIADALDLSPKQQRSITALLQTDADDAPEGDFAFHGDDIIATLQDLEKEFKAKKAEVDQIEGQNKKDFNEVMKSKTNEKKTAEGDKKTAEGEKDTADENIAKATEDMVKEEALLKDDELYLKDLTSKCELKAREWDQRSQMRSEEVTALTAALKIIKEGVSANSAVNKRAFIQQDGDNVPVDTKALKTPEKADARSNADEDDVDVAGLDVDLSFLQVSKPRLKIASLVKQASQVSTGEAQQAALKEKVIKSLVASGSKLGSAVLSSLAMKVAADPFIKVKKLIQDLIERLVTEAAEEATKKGWCDTELGKATHTRDSNMDKIMELNAELEGLEATKAKLEEEIATLTTEIADLNDALTKETKMRADEKAENMDTLDKAKAGLAATKDAYDVLQAFYKKGAKGKVSLIQASPVDADSPASPSGAYKGGQQKAGGILAMLDVIISDFERTIKVTTKAEKASHREFVEFERTSKTSIASKETGKSQAESDLKSTDSKIAESMDDLEKHQDMLDDVLKELEDLKPACVDTGMSYADRVQKRKDEIDALKKALCELDPEKVEDQCK
jgi:septal ring factor EnvC (AmiA/AmiB activator)